MHTQDSRDRSLNVRQDEVLPRAGVSSSVKVPNEVRTDEQRVDEVQSARMDDLKPVKTEKARCDRG